MRISVNRKLHLFRATTTFSLGCGCSPPRMPKPRSRNGCRGVLGYSVAAAPAPARPMEEHTVFRVASIRTLALGFFLGQRPDS